jgi:hypothetical protein
MTVPALSPVAAPLVVCPNCKNLLEPEVTKGKAKSMTEVKYACVNEETNCTWVMVMSVSHVNCEMMQMKEEEITKRREQAKADAEMKATKDAQVRKLIMLLPHIETLLAAVAPVAEDAEQPAIVEDPKKPLSPAPVEVPEPSAEPVEA